VTGITPNDSRGAVLTFFRYDPFGNFLAGVPSYRSDANVTPEQFRTRDQKGAIMRFKCLLILFPTAFLAASAALGQSQAPPNQGAPKLTEIQAPTEQPRKDLLDALSKSEQEGIVKSAVPVLLLPNIREFEKRSFVVREIYYTAFFGNGKQFISIQGSRLAYTYPHLKTEPNVGKMRVRSTEGSITESERIWTASWKEFGAAYLLSLECADEKDKGCQSPEYTSQFDEFSRLCWRRTG